MGNYRYILVIVSVIVLLYFCWDQWNVYHLIAFQPQNSESVPTQSYLHHTNKSAIIKDFELKSLLQILNSQQQFFRSWDTNLDNDQFARRYALFASSLLPWLVGEPPSPLVVSDYPVSIREHLNCANKRYSTALTGQKLSKPRVIVDFIPFGYDVDKLELRLLENFEYVDAFVIFESTLTQTGTPKSHIFPMIRDTARFSRFKDKIIYLHANSVDMKDRLEANWKWSSNNWQLELMMRTEMLRRFQEITVSHEQFSLYQKVLDAVFAPKRLLSECRPAGWSEPPGDAEHAISGRRDKSNVSDRSGSVDALWSDMSACLYSDKWDAKEPVALGIQNDGDEFATGRSLFHLKHCVLREPTATTFLPIFSFKSSVELVHLEGNHRIDGQMPPSLRRFVAVAPAIHTAPLAYFMIHNSTFRGAGFNGHMNLGSGVHLSSISDPVEHWWKSISTQHGMQNLEMRKSMPGWFIEAGKYGNISADMIRNVTGMDTACGSEGGNTDMVSISSLSKEDRAFLLKALPWALLANLQRFPFIAPPCASIHRSRIFRTKFLRSQR